MAPRRPCTPLKLNHELPHNTVGYETRTAARISRRMNVEQGSKRFRSDDYPSDGRAETRARRRSCDLVLAVVVGGSTLETARDAQARAP